MERRSFFGGGLAAGVLAALPTQAVAGPSVTGGTASLGRVLNVSNFGAVGDGVADDTAALQRAAATLADGGSLYLPPGTYRLLAPLQLGAVKRVSLIGHGAASRLLAGAEMPALLRLERAEQSSIQGLGLDANGKAEVALDVAVPWHLRIASLFVWAPRKIGIRCGSPDAPGIECLIQDSLIEGRPQPTHDDPASSIGIYFDRRQTDNHINNIVVRGFADTGVELLGASNLLHQVHVYRHPAFQYQYGVRIRGRNTQLVQCYLDNASASGVEVLADNALIQSCYFLRTRWAFNDGRAPLQRGGGVRIGAPQFDARDARVLGCCFDARPMPEGGEFIAIEVVKAPRLLCEQNIFSGSQDGRNTSASGSTVIPAGSKRVRIAHRTLLPPATVMLTPEGDVGDRRYWVDGITRRNFSIHLSSAAPTALRFFWQASGAMA